MINCPLIIIFIIIGYIKGIKYFFNIIEMDFEIDCTLEKVKSILNQPNNQELQEDLILKQVIEIIFRENNMILYPRNKRISSNSLFKFIDVISSLFNLSKEKRESFYII